jgi:hypothetical protein
MILFFLRCRQRQAPLFTVATQQTPGRLAFLDTPDHARQVPNYRSDEPFCCRRGNGRAGWTATHRHMHGHRSDGRPARIERNYIIRRDASAWMDMRVGDMPRH